MSNTHERSDHFFIRKFNTLMKVVHHCMNIMGNTFSENVQQTGKGKSETLG